MVIDMEEIEGDGKRETVRNEEIVNQRKEGRGREEENERETDEANEKKDRDTDF